MKNNKTPLNEITRYDILTRSKKESKKRYDKKQFYKSSRFGTVDFEELVNNDSFVWKCIVGDYNVIIAFEGPFENLKWEVRSWRGPNRIKRINLQLLTNCISRALDEEDLQVSCSCPDFKFRFSYWLSRPDVDAKYGMKQNVAPTVRNVNNNQGYVCKHVLACLFGKRWTIAAAKAWKQFIDANPDFVADRLWGDD